MNESEKEPRFRLETASAFLSKPQPELEWLIENVWVDKARGLIAGNPGVGKTWLALDMLISVASGLPCLGKYPVKKGAVLLVEEEASELNLSRRLHAMARARGLKDEHLSNFFLLTRQFAKIPQDATELFHLIAGNDIRLVVFDSLRRFHNCDENSSSEMQAVLDSFARLNAMTGASIVLIHHLAKGSGDHAKPLFERLRGSSDFWAWRDCLIGVEGEEDADECTASFQFRDAESPAPIRIKRHVGAQSGAVALEALDLEETEAFQEKSESILAYLRTRLDGASMEQVCKAIGGRKQDLARVFKAMARQRLLAKTGSKWVVPEIAERPGTDFNGSHV